jgi:hypothetical protein
MVGILWKDKRILYIKKASNYAQKGKGILEDQKKMEDWSKEILMGIEQAVSSNS